MISVECLMSVFEFEINVDKEERKQTRARGKRGTRLRRGGEGGRRRGSAFQLPHSIASVMSKACRSRRPLGGQSMQELHLG